MKSHEKFFKYVAKHVASHSLCLRDKCGAAIVLEDDSIAGIGYNAPPQNNISYRKCRIDFPVIHRKKPKASCQCCDHAEIRAIFAAIRNYHDLNGSRMYFTRVDEYGNILFSGEPYCVECARLALHVGIETWVLWHEDGIKIYDAKEYYDISYEYHRTIKK